MRNFVRLLALCTAFAPLAAFAAVANGDLTVTAMVTPTCNVAAASLNLGTYDGTDPVDASGVADVSVTCTNGTGATIGLDNGLHYTATEGRQLASGANLLRYELYTDEAMSQPFALAAPGVVPITGTGTAMTVQVHGKIPAGQTPPAGTYTDTVQIEVTF